MHYQGRGPAEQDADRVGDHIENFVHTVAERSLDELEADAHRDEARGIDDSGLQSRIQETEPEHERAVGEEMPQLVAMLETGLGRRRDERQPYDRSDPCPAEREE